MAGGSARAGTTAGLGQVSAADTPGFSASVGGVASLGGVAARTAAAGRVVIGVEVQGVQIGTAAGGAGAPARTICGTEGAGTEGATMEGAGAVRAGTAVGIGAASGFASAWRMPAASSLYWWVSLCSVDTVLNLCPVARPVDFDLEAALNPGLTGLGFGALGTGLDAGGFTISSPTTPGVSADVPTRLSTAAGIVAVLVVRVFPPGSACCHPTLKSCASARWVVLGGAIPGGWRLATELMPWLLATRGGHVGTSTGVVCFGASRRPASAWLSVTLAVGLPRDRLLTSCTRSTSCAVIAPF